jgi:hypothetical protein
VWSAACVRARAPVHYFSINPDSSNAARVSVAAMKTAVDSFVGVAVFAGLVERGEVATGQLRDVRRSVDASKRKSPDRVSSNAGRDKVSGGHSKMVQRRLSNQSRVTDLLTMYCAAIRPCLRTVEGLLFAFP